LSVPGIPADSLPDIFLISPLRADFIRWQPGAAGAPLCPAFLAVSLPRCHRPHDHLCTLGSPLNLGDGPDALPHARRSWRHGDPPPIPLGRAAMATASAAMVSAVIAISGHCPIRPASVIWARYPGLEHRPLPGAATLQHLAVRCDDVTHPRRGGIYDGAAGLDSNPSHRELLRPLAGLAVHVHRSVDCTARRIGASGHLGPEPDGQRAAQAPASTGQLRARRYRRRGRLVTR